MSPPHEPSSAPSRPEPDPNPPSESAAPPGRPPSVQSLSPTAQPHRQPAAAAGNGVALAVPSPAEEAGAAGASWQPSAAAAELGPSRTALQPAEAPAAERSVAGPAGAPAAGVAAEPSPAAAASAPAAPHPAGAPAWLRDLAGAWIFYSVLPAWPAPAPRFQRIARFAPWIGALLGGLQGLLWWLLQGHAPPLAQVCLVLAAGLWLSGGLHMDGAMDTADGLAAGERLLEAMADSRVGASGVQALALVLLLRAAALAWLGPLAPLALLWAAVWGRSSPLIAMARFPYLRQRGSAAFHRRHWAGLARELRPALLLLAALALFTWSVRGPGVLPLGQALLGLPPALLVPLWLGRRLGGHSGDSYGACVEWSESLALLLMAALPLGAIWA